MKKHCFLTLALIFGLAPHALSTEMTYEDYKQQRDLIFKFIKTPEIALQILKKEALNIGIQSKEITADLKKIKNLEKGINNYGEFLLSLCPCALPYEPTQEEQDEIEEIKDRTKQNIQILLYKIRFTTEEILNIATRKSPKEISDKEKSKIKEEFEKIDQQKNCTVEEKAKQTLDLAAHAQNLFLKKKSSNLQIAGIIALIAVGATGIVAAGIYFGWWKKTWSVIKEWATIKKSTCEHTSKITCLDVCKTQYEEICRPGHCYDSNSIPTESCSNGKCSPIQIGLDPENPNAEYFKKVDTNLTPKGSDGWRCREDAPENCELEVFLVEEQTT